MKHLIVIANLFLIFLSSAFAQRPCIMSIQCSPYSHTIRGFLYDANDLQQYNAIPGGYNLNVFYRDQNDQSQNFRMVYVGDTRGCGTMCNMKALISAKRAGAESANANCQEQLQMYVNAYGYCR